MGADRSAVDITGDGSAADPRVVRTRRDVLGVALDVLLDEGLEAVTHQHVAQVAGYSKATVYAHWPGRMDLVGDCLGRFVHTRHHRPTGDLRTDLIEELILLRSAMVEQRLDRALAVLVDLTSTTPELAPVRDRLVAESERVVRQLLAPVLTAARLEAATLTLCGGVLHSALMHGQLPADDVVEAAVDLVLGGVRGGGH